MHLCFLNSLIKLHGLIPNNMSTVLRELRKNNTAEWYSSMHSTIARRIWMRRLPQGGVFFRVIVRLRTGYTTIGAMLPFLPEQRCPECGAVDSIEHLLLTCIALIERRSQLFSKITNLTLETVTVPLLLGFSTSLPNRTLRKITNETARFVVDCKRWP